ncbi:MAG: TetR/AcrR family transcriptional regulator [Anaerolineae bacterium]|jgi:TetR/AcrR family transcriptional regulator
MTTRARRKREKEERRQSILQAAREVFFENGFHQATVEAVAERAEVSKGTVYLYFESKETILAHLLLEGLRELDRRLEEAYAVEEELPADDRLRRLGWAYFKFFRQEPRYFHFLMAMDRGRFREVVDPVVYRKALEASMEGLGWVVRAVEQGIEGKIFDTCDVRQAAATLWATLNGVLELTEHPLRREMVGLKSKTLYEAALETIIQGLRLPQKEQGGV